jgi:hypothetical protein
MTLDAALLETILKHERTCMETLGKPIPSNSQREQEAWMRMLRDRHATAQQFAEQAIAQVLESQDD